MNEQISGGAIRACDIRSAPNVLITGAGRRIGAAIALDLARHGYGVAIHSHRSQQEAENLARRIIEQGGRALQVAGDLLNPQGLRAIVTEAGNALGPITLLINNASIFEPDGIGSLDIDRFDRHFAIHTRAPLFLSEAFAEQLPAGDHGLVVNIIDQRVLRPTPHFLSYAMSKSALWAQTQMLAQALAPMVRVNAIGPGPTLANERQSAKDFRKQAQSVLLGHGPELDEFGRTIRYLWETPSITGQMIALDGGQHLAWETPDVVGIRE